MADLTRKQMTILGGNAGGSEIGVFGSKADDDPDYSTDPNVIQSLPAWAAGWYSAVIGKMPCIEDLNAMSYVLSYQLAYLLQKGIPEWSSTETYYMTSFASDGAGRVYKSIQNGNTGNALSNASWWLEITLPPQAGNDGRYLYTNGTSASWQAAPAASLSLPGTVTREAYGNANWTLGGLTTSPSIPVYWARSGNLVTVCVRGNGAMTKNGTAGVCSFASALAAEFRPPHEVGNMAWDASSALYVSASGTVSIMYPYGSGGNWPANNAVNFGTTGQMLSISYRVN